MQLGKYMSLPISTACLGPESRRRLLRSLCSYAVLLSIGTMLAHLAETPGMRAFGLGLVVPGAGFLAYAVGDGWAMTTHVVLFLISLLSFAASLIAWFGAGAAIAPPLVWIATALWALWMNHPGIAGGGDAIILWIPMLGAGALGLALLTVIRAKAPELADCSIFEAIAEPIVKEAGEEFPPDTLARLRFALDRALQPVDQFAGFQWVDQFQPAAVRYQLNFAGYALSLAQRRLPAFQDGYLYEAQRRLIEKQRDWRIWRYWRLENAWGNLRLDADPIVRDNIMYSGFVAAQIAAFQAATGDRQFAQPGGFELRTPGGRVFSHDFMTMTDALLRGWRSSPYGLMPCEPNWVYPMCNAIGAGALIARDAQFGQAHWPEIQDHFRRGLDSEFTNRSGRLVAFRSTLTGIAPPHIGGAAADATPALFFNTSFPDVAQRLMTLLREDVLTADGTLNRRFFWKIDTGDYRCSRAASFTSVAAAAIEMGDPDLATAVLEMLEEECPTVVESGVAHRRNASVFAHFVELLALMGVTYALRSNLRQPMRARSGPWLSAARYPEILVSRADWSAEGHLRLTLYPGRGSGLQTISLAGFRPGAKFSFTGTASGNSTASANGRADIMVPITGRTEIIVRQMR